MRTMTKCAVAALFTAGLLGAGAGAATADTHSESEIYQACIKEQNTLGLINLDLDLLNQCIANYND